ncbi:MAG: aspartate/glutamate racemase family protein [Acidiferrobacterales bacterium]
MSSHRIALIHATPLAHEPIWEALTRLWPESTAINLTDDSLSRDLDELGELTRSMAERIVSLARYAASCGANGVLFTCSGFATAIDEAKKAVSIPVLKPDEAMIEEALSTGSRIGALATFRPTIDSLKAELEAAAAERGVSPQIDLRHVPRAMEALRAGKAAEHDAMIARAAEALSAHDVVILAQFSMARARTAIAQVPRRRVLTSPDSAVKRLQELIASPSVIEK